MGNGLFQLGKWTFDHRKRVIVSVLAVLVLFAAIGIAAGPKFDDNMSLSGTESAKANKLLEKEFPATQTNGGQIQVVMKAPKGSTLDSKESTAANKNAPKNLIYLFNMIYCNKKSPPYFGRDLAGNHMIFNSFYPFYILTNVVK